MNPNSLFALNNRKQVGRETACLPARLPVYLPGLLELLTRVGTIWLLCSPPTRMHGGWMWSQI